MSPEAKEKCTKWIEAINYMISNREINFYTLDHLKRVFSVQMVRDDPHPLEFDSKSILAFMQSLDRLPEKDIRTFLKEVSGYGLYNFYLLLPSLRSIIRLTIGYIG